MSAVCSAARSVGEWGEIAGDRDEDAPALVGVSPDRELSDSRLQHLVRMEAGVLTQQCAR